MEWKQQCKRRCKPQGAPILTKYTAHIYRHVGTTNTYDVEVFTTETVPTLTNPSGCSRSCVYTLTVPSMQTVSLKTLTRYFYWKFSTCQIGDCIRTSCIFTNIVNSLAWITSIVDVEFDFHVGEKLCTHPDNAKYLDIYTKSPHTGYKLSRADCGTTDDNP